MQLYGNMPLIEPLETKEVRRIEDFVVVIDTSMSCSGELVKKFLEETYGVLAQSESFFKKVNIHILQCDDKVRQDVKIESEEDLGITWTTWNSMAWAGLISARHSCMWTR